MSTEQLSPHDAAMVAKVDQASAALQPVSAPAPAVPETQASAASDTPPAATPPAAPAVDAAAQAAADAAKAAGAPAGVDYAAFSQEFATTGKLSEDSYKALEAKGLPKALVDEFIQSKQAAARVAEYEAKEAVSEAHGWAGGSDAFSNMLTWAATNLSAADQAAFDTAVTGDSASRKQAVVALKAQYEQARGSDPKLVAGEGQSGGEGAFESRAQVTEAMRDPRYRSDPAYRALVERRIGLMASF